MITAPARRRAGNGKTPSVLSGTKWSYQEFIGGVAVNVKFSKAALQAEVLLRTEHVL